MKHGVAQVLICENCGCEWLKRDEILIWKCKHCEKEICEECQRGHWEDECTENPKRA